MSAQPGQVAAITPPLPSSRREGIGRAWRQLRRNYLSLAGSCIVVSLVLSRVHSPYWLLFTAFVGVNLFQSALTRWCLMENSLAKLGVPPCEHAKHPVQQQPTA